MAQEEVVVGVLALQGAFKQHVQLFEKIGVKAMEIRTPEELSKVHALVLPGGESTAIALVARRTGLMDPLREWVAQGKPIWGTCAGMILLADKITGKMKTNDDAAAARGGCTNNDCDSEQPQQRQQQEGQELIGGFPGVVHRNFFGSQLGSFSAMLESPLGGGDGADAGAEQKKQYRAVFIRAPVLAEYGDSVTVLATVVPHKESQEADAKVDAHEPTVVAASHANILITSFHPELTEDAAWHQYFFNFATKALKASASSA